LNIQTFVYEIGFFCENCTPNMSLSQQMKCSISTGLEKV